MRFSIDSKTCSARATWSSYPADMVHAADPSALLSDAYSRVVAAARRGLGTEPLTQETLRMISGPSPE
jgi:hypothetical protein